MSYWIILIDFSCDFLSYSSSSTRLVFSSPHNSFYSSSSLSEISVLSLLCGQRTLLELKGNQDAPISQRFEELLLPKYIQLKLLLFIMMGCIDSKGATVEPQKLEKANSFDEAINFLKQGQISSTLGVFKNALAEVPAPESVIYENVGKVLLRLGFYESSKEYFEKTLEKDPKNTAALRELAKIYRTNNDPKTVSALLNRALDIDSSEIETINLLMINECQRGLFTQAVDLFDTAMRKIEENHISFHGNASIIDIAQANFYNNAGNVYRYSDRQEDAIECYEKAIQLNGENSLYYVNCAVTLAHPKIQNYKKAYQYLSTAENLLVRSISSGNSYVLHEIREFKYQIEQWQFKKSYNFATAEERQSLSERMGSLEKKISNLFQTDLSDDIFQYTMELETKILFEDICNSWYTHKMSLESIFSIDAAVYSLYTKNENYFAIIPFHLVVFGLRELRSKNSIKSIELKVMKAVGGLAQKYPPSANTAISGTCQIESFELPAGELPNMFENKFFKSYENLMNEILALAEKSRKVFPEFQAFLKPICLAKGHKFKSGTKFPADADGITESKIIIRVAEKLFKELKDKKQQLWLKVEDNLKKEVCSAKVMTMLFLRGFKEAITEILQQRIKEKKETVCRIYDFVRAKCMYKSLQDAEETASVLIKACKQAGHRIIECDNRLLKGTKDIVFKIEFGSVVGQIQLAMQFDSTLNEFNHGLYEIKRSPGGSIFGSILWLGKLSGLQFVTDLKSLKKDFQSIPSGDTAQPIFQQSLTYVLEQFEELK